MTAPKKKPSLFLRPAFQKAVLTVAMMTAAGGVVWENSYGTQEHMQITITGEHQAWLRKGEGFGLHKTVYETDKGEFSNTTNMLVGKFSRAAIANELKVGQTYDVTVNGFSMPFLGKYKNIIAATPVPAPKKPAR